LKPVALTNPRGAPEADLCGSQSSPKVWGPLRWVVYPKIADCLSKVCTNAASEFLVPEVE